MIKQREPNLFNSQGQTLIETLVAIFMLVMGISASLGLAIYALNSSTSITKQIIATGLAREGLEAVKDMRDTNWLQQTAIDTGCYDFTTGSNSPGTNCYKDWLGDKNLARMPYCLNPSNNANCHGDDQSDSYFLTFDQTISGTGYWKFNLDNTNTKFGLLYDPSNSNQKGFYYAPNGGTSCGNAASMSDYCRKIVLTLDFRAPYNHPSAPPNSYDASTEGPGPMVLVQSQVWWVDKKCSRVSDFSLAPAGCRLEIDAYLTNWKNYNP